MNGRLFAKRFVGAAALLFGLAALAADGEAWAKVAPATRPRPT